jgi:cysteine desulfurase / selenocysteine lyase
MTSAQNETRTNAGFDVEAVRREFPILHQEVHGKPLVYLDSAATTQKPQCVIDAVRGYYEHDNANVHRGMHELSNRATAQYENARRLVQRHIGAGDAREIIFTRGTTESINLVAQSWGRLRLSAGDEVLVSQMEHHSNIVPWQLLRDQIGITIKPIPVTDTGELDLDSYEKLLSDKTKLVAVGHVSNVLGTINPIKHMAKLAHDAGAAIVVDGAQAMPHMRVDVRELDVDFYAISAHKMYGPTGIGALFGKLEHLTAMPPYQGGGEMIKSVTFDKTIYNDPPHKFEAGTPNIAGTIGFAAATEFLQRIGLDSVAAHEHDVLNTAWSNSRKCPA